jgi:hypothetical protein
MNVSDTVWIITITFGYFISLIVLAFSIMCYQEDSSERRKSDTPHYPDFTGR